MSQLPRLAIYLLHKNNLPLDVQVAHLFFRPSRPEHFGCFTPPVSPMRSPPKVHGRGAVEMLTESENKSCTPSLSHPRHYHHPVFTFGPMHPTTCPFHALLSCRSWSRNNYILLHGAITPTVLFPSNAQCSMRYLCHFNWRDKPKEGKKIGWTEFIAGIAKARQVFVFEELSES